jgi:molybdopterin synthase catalytic subunit
VAVETSITVQVRLFASYREAAGAGKLEQGLPSGSTVRDLVTALSDRVPALANGKGLVAVNLEYVDADFPLRGGEEVAFIPPVSGGAR